ncbi:MAG TPA: protein translocase subunit SecF [Candidatus Paceibacterota bacterium]|nr:protein translocase subunit SecF [Candidatus Paceibacterota bacterium]
MLNIIGHKNIFLTISALAVGAALVAILTFGLREGVDFQGGTLWRVHIQNTDSQKIEDVFHNDLKVVDAHVTAESTADNYLIKLPAIGEGAHNAYSSNLKTKFPNIEELSYQSIGPTVGAELRKNSLIAIALVLVGISLYIAFAFRKVFRPVSSWTYGTMTLITLFHDVAIPAGLLAVLGKYANVEIDGNFIVALLVIMGFSVHDTIVVFDRIRENLMLDRAKSAFAHVVNTSVNQTLARSINTSLTLILVLVALYFAGPSSLHYFILTLLIGVTTGIYSSIFVASPLLIVWQNFQGQEEKKRN